VIGAVVLAAGAASRFGSPKQRLFLPEVLRRLRAGGIEEIVVVAGAHELEADARIVHCEEWERGPGASLRCGVAAFGPDVDAALVVLADGPELDPRAVARVAARWREHGHPVLAASYGGQRLHPVLLAREAWSQVPDEGARGLEAVAVPCDDLDPPGDVDFADDIGGRPPPPNAES
jgi:nicotine blue oxidoreductase